MSREVLRFGSFLVLGDRTHPLHNWGCSLELADLLESFVHRETRTKIPLAYATIA